MFRIALLAAAIALPSLTYAQSADEPPIYERRLFDGFEGTDFAPEGGLYYRENFEQSAGRYEFQSAVKRTGNGGLKLSIVPNCPADHDGCSERAEIWEKTELRVPYDKGVWYGFSVKFADPVPSDDHRYLIAQWKREIDPGAEGDFSPFLALRMNSGKLFATVETNHLPPVSAGLDGVPARCAPGQAPVWLRPEVNQMRMLVATDGNWKPETATSSMHARTDHNHQPWQSPAGSEVRLDRFRRLHEARSRRLGPHSALCQRPADHHRQGPCRPCGQGPR